MPVILAGMMPVMWLPPYPAMILSFVNGTKKFKLLTEGKASIPEPVDAFLESGLDVGRFCAGQQ